jgi:hypothetical protein
MDREWQMFRDQKIEPEDIPGIIGKEPAKRLLATPRGGGFPAEHEISGLDLKVGGEWATKLYDESMVNRFNKMGKRYGVRVEEMPLVSKPWVIKYGRGFERGEEYADSWPKAVQKFTRQVDDRLIPEFDRRLLTKNISREELNKYFLDARIFLDVNNKPISFGEMVTSTGSSILNVPISTVHSLKITPEMKESIGASKFHPFADLPGPIPKPALPAAPKSPDFHAEAAALDPANPVRYAGDIGGYPMFEQGGQGVGSFIQRPGETVADAFARARERYQT